MVGKKIAKKAVERNYIRRRLFEATRLELPTTGRAYDIVITVFDKEVAEMEFPRIQDTLKKMFMSAQII